MRGELHFTRESDAIMRKPLICVGVLTALTCGANGAWADEAASKDFVAKAIQGNLAEVAVGQLAQQKGATEGVRQFGQQLVADHSSANDKLKQVATSMGVTAPTEPNDEQKNMQQKLSGMSGTDFDRAFSSGMVTDHQKDIAAYQGEAKEKDAAGQYAQDTLPTLQKHLSMAQSLAGSAAAAPADTTMAPAATSPAVTAPAANAPAATTPATTDTAAAAGPPFPGANSFTEGQARSRIENAGFTNVNGLKKDDQGIWRGQASKNNATTSVSLDFKGNVTSP
jgi:putative membrane protein